MVRLRLARLRDHCVLLPHYEVMSHDNTLAEGGDSQDIPTQGQAFEGWPSLLSALTEGQDLTTGQAQAALDTILAGDATDAQIAAFIVGLRQKGETVEELVGMVASMRAAGVALTAPPDTIDIVGMGGSPQRRRAALNVSTMACFVAAGAGAFVCKHGNLKASSTSGSFDLLNRCGIPFEVEPSELEATINEHGLGFAFARLFHPAMRHVGPVRGQLGIPTVFNALGPVANPAGVTRQVVGVADASLGRHMAEVLLATGTVKAWVVTGHENLDELSTTGPSKVSVVGESGITQLEVDPSEYGIAIPEPGALDGGDAETNFGIMQRLFASDPELQAVRDIVTLNAAAGLVVADLASDLNEGLEQACESIDSGTAAQKVAALATEGNDA